MPADQDRSSSWEDEMLKIITKLLSRRDSELFREPVKWKELGLVDYVEVIKTPMDLGTIKKKLDAKEYLKKENCASDIRLVW